MNYLIKSKFIRSINFIGTATTIVTFIISITLI